MKKSFFFLFQQHFEYKTFFRCYAANHNYGLYIMDDDVVVAVVYCVYVAHD